MEMSDKKKLYGFILTADSDFDGKYTLKNVSGNPFKFVSKEDFKSNKVKIDDNNSFKIFQENSFNNSSIIGGVFAENFEELLSLYPNIIKEVLSNSIFQESVLKHQEYYFQSGRNNNITYENFDRVTKEYLYDALSEESVSYKKITASFNDDEESLKLKVQTKNRRILINVLKNIFEIDEKKIKIEKTSENSQDDLDFFVYRSAIIASRASEKYGADIELYFKPISITPKIKIKHTSFISELKVLQEDNIDIEIDLGNTFCFQSEICNYISKNIKKILKVDNFNYNIKIKESDRECTLLSVDYINSCIYSSIFQFSSYLSDYLKIQSFNFYDFSSLKDIKEIYKFYKRTKAKLFDNLSSNMFHNIQRYHIPELNEKTFFCFLPISYLSFANFIKDIFKNSFIEISIPLTSILTLNSFIDYVSFDLYIKEVHIFLPTVKDKDKIIDCNVIKLKVMKIFKKIGVLISKNLNYSTDFIIKYNPEETIQFNNIETVLNTLLLSGVNSVKDSFLRTRSNSLSLSQINIKKGENTQ